MCPEPVQQMFWPYARLQGPACTTGPVLHALNALQRSATWSSTVWCKPCVQQVEDTEREQSMLGTAGELQVGQESSGVHLPYLAIR